MKKIEYELIKLDALRDDLRSCAMVQGSPSYNTLLCIFASIAQKTTSFTFAKHKKRKGHYYERYTTSEISIAELAEEISFPSVLLARLILEELFLRRDGAAGCNQLAHHIGECLKDTSLIGDTELAQHVEYCLKTDDHYGPTVTRTRRLIGLEYEYILQQKLRNLNIPFVSEDFLRKIESPTTPDVLLEMPIAVNGRIVHWIDSKATFGDEYTDSKVADQVIRYFNRHGPGMVIYWFDFIEELDTRLEFFLQNGFPSRDDIITLLDDDTTPGDDVLQPETELFIEPPP